MKEFNENPFKKDTPVVPFSNGTECMVWRDGNCDQCDKYEAESTKAEEAGCELAFYLDQAEITGTMPLWIAKEIGCEYDPLYVSIRLDNKCRKLNDNRRPF